MSNDKITARASSLIRRPAAEAFAAFANADKMSQFWFTRRDDGLKEGEPCTWSMGSGETAFSFEVQIKTLREPELIIMEWVGPDDNATQVTWNFEAKDDGDTVVTIEESGFAGADEAIVARALDSTGGFNQVLIAAKALIEHGVAVNVVADHA